MNPNSNIYYCHSDKETLIEAGVEILDDLGEGQFYFEGTEEQAKSLIPKNTDYCYSGNGICPYWNFMPNLPQQDAGFCHFLKRGDFTEPGTFLLWDQCKECGVSPYEPTDEELGIKN